MVQGILQNLNPILFETLFRMNPLLKQIFDTSISALSLIILLPVMIILGLLVLVSSRGPIIFKQHRVGKRGKLFYIDLHNSQ